MMKKITFLLIIVLSLLIGSVISAATQSTPVAGSPRASVTPGTAVRSDNDIVKVGQDITIEAGETVRNVTTVRGDITIRGHVTESVIAVLGDIHVMSGGVVDGDVFTIRGNINKDPGAVIHGKQSVSGNRKRINPHTPFPFIRLLLLSVIIVVLVTIFFPERLTKVSNVILKKPVLSWWNGIIASLLIVPIALILFVTCIGIPIIIVEILLVIILWICGKVAVDIALGKRFFTALNRPIGSIIFAAIFGEVILGIISLTPVLGCIIVYLVSVAGFGAVIRTGFGKDEQWLDNYIRKWTNRPPAVIPGDDSSAIDGN